MALVRVDRFFSQQDIFTRSEIKAVLKKGCISVNENKVLNSSFKIDTDKDIVRLNGEIIQYSPYIYIMLNKPAGVVSSTEEKNAKTVLDLVPENLYRKGLFPAGRLDKDTLGFVLLTNDGCFAHDILSPSHHVSKTYIVNIDTPLSSEGKSKIESGIELSDGTMCKPATLNEITADKKNYEIVIKEGRYHQIKRMFAAVSCKVIGLKRIKIGGLFLDEKLQEGECRVILHKELQQILCN